MPYGRGTLSTFDMAQSMENDRGDKGRDKDAERGHECYRKVESGGSTLELVSSKALDESTTVNGGDILEEVVGETTVACPWMSWRGLYCMWVNQKLDEERSLGNFGFRDCFDIGSEENPIKQGWCGEVMSILESYYFHCFDSTGFTVIGENVYIKHLMVWKPYLSWMKENCLHKQRPIVEALTIVLDDGFCGALRDDNPSALLVNWLFGVASFLDTELAHRTSHKYCSRCDQCMRIETLITDGLDSAFEGLGRLIPRKYLCVAKFYLDELQRLKELHIRDTLMNSVGESEREEVQAHVADKIVEMEDFAQEAAGWIDSVDIQLGCLLPMDRNNEWLRRLYNSALYLKVRMADAGVSRFFQKFHLKFHEYRMLYHGHPDRRFEGYDDLSLVYADEREVDVVDGFVPPGKEEEDEDSVHLHDTMPYKDFREGGMDGEPIERDDWDLPPVDELDRSIVDLVTMKMKIQEGVSNDRYSKGNMIIYDDLWASEREGSCGGIGTTSWEIVSSSGGNVELMHVEREDDTKHAKLMWEVLDSVFACSRHLIPQFVIHRMNNTSLIELEKMDSRDEWGLLCMQKVCGDLTQVQIEEILPLILYSGKIIKAVNTSDEESVLREYSRLNEGTQYLVQRSLAYYVRMIWMMKVVAQDKLGWRLPANVLYEAFQWEMTMNVQYIDCTLLLFFGVQVDWRLGLNIGQDSEDDPNTQMHTLLDIIQWTLQQCRVNDIWWEEEVIVPMIPLGRVRVPMCDLKEILLEYWMTIFWKGIQYKIRNQLLFEDCVQCVLQSKERQLYLHYGKIAVLNVSDFVILTERDDCVHFPFKIRQMDRAHVHEIIKLCQEKVRLKDKFAMDCKIICGKITGEICASYVVLHVSVLAMFITLDVKIPAYVGLGYLALHKDLGNHVSETIKQYQQQWPVYDYSEWLKYDDDLPPFEEKGLAPEQFEDGESSVSDNEEVLSGVENLDDFVDDSVAHEILAGLSEDEESNGDGSSNDPFA